MKFYRGIPFLVFLFACNNHQANNSVVPGVENKTVSYEQGKTIFLGRCASCHMVNKELTGPALRGVENRWPNRQKLFGFIRNSEEIIKQDDYAHRLWLQFNQTIMNKHPDLTDAQIEQVLGYIKSVSVNP